MGALLVYVLKSSVCLAVFYLFYRLLLSKETFHRFNRCALLGVSFLSLLLPGIEWRTVVPIDAGGAMVQVEEFLLSGQYEENSEGDFQYSWQFILVVLYALGIVVFWVRQLVSLGSMYQLIRCSRQEEFAGNIRLSIHDKLIGPFSWMHYIVMSETDLQENGEAILLHEQAHVRNGHSWDLLWMDFCISLQWFNPVVWLVKRELQDVHEFEADESVINQGVDAKRYQLLLIKKSVGTRLYSMANSFNHSSLKKRITMMVKKKSNPWARMKYLYVLPLAAIAVAAFARPEVSSELNEISSVKVSDFVADMKVRSAENVLDSKEKFKLQGRVVDESGGPISNATVIVKNTSYGTVTKDDGRFSLMLSPGQEICISYIGMEMKVVGIPKSESKEKLIVLKPEAVSVGELQVSGNGTAVQQKTMQEPVKQKIDEQGDVFTVVEQMPEFPGGIRELMSFLGKNIRYPVEAHKNNIEGRVIVQFLVKKDGSTSNFKVIRSVHPLLDAEAVRVLKTMPKWTPGTQRGQAVDVRYTIPVTFALQRKTQPGTSAGSDSSANKFTAMESIPQYPGGTKELMNFLSKNIQYPAEARTKGVQGRVIVQFMVNKDGSTSDFKVLRSIHPLLDAEALRVLKTMPKWTPGTQKGQAVNAKFVVPVSFSLKGDKEQKTLEGLKLTVDQSVNREIVEDIRGTLFVKNKTGKAAPSSGEKVLVLVDGKELGTGTQLLSTIPIETIDVIQILSEPEKIAQYGDKGKNGVILVQTKQKNSEK